MINLKMLFYVLIILLINITIISSVATDKTYKECNQKINIDCDGECNIQLSKCFNYNSKVQRTD